MPPTPLACSARYDERTGHVIGARARSTSLTKGGAGPSDPGREPSRSASRQAGVSPRCARTVERHRCARAFSHRVAPAGIKESLRRAPTSPGLVSSPCVAHCRCHGHVHDQQSSRCSGTASAPRPPGAQAVITIAAVDRSTAAVPPARRSKSGLAAAHSMTAGPSHRPCAVGRRTRRCLVCSTGLIGIPLPLDDRAGLSSAGRVFVSAEEAGPADGTRAARGDPDDRLPSPSRSMVERRGF